MKVYRIDCKDFNLLGRFSLFVVADSIKNAIQTAITEFNKEHSVYIDEGRIEGITCLSDNVFLQSDNNAFAAEEK